MAELAHSETAHDRIVRTMRERIESGAWPKGSAVPSEAVLGREFQVARGTVRAALQTMQDANLIVVVAAKGRYVADGVEGSGTAPSQEARRIAGELRAELESGIHGPGSKFLSEAALSERFHASRYTAKLALAELSSQGLIVAIHGRGHFVPQQTSSP